MVKALQLLLRYDLQSCIELKVTNVLVLFIIVFTVCQWRKNIFRITCQRNLILCSVLRVKFISLLAFQELILCWIVTILFRRFVCMVQLAFSGTIQYYLILELEASTMIGRIKLISHWNFLVLEIIKVDELDARRINISYYFLWLTVFVNIHNSCSTKVWNLLDFLQCIVNFSVLPLAKEIRPIICILVLLRVTIWEVWWITWRLLLLWWQVIFLSVLLLRYSHGWNIWLGVFL